MKRPKARILKNGKNQYIVQIRVGFWPFYEWNHLSYFPNSRKIYTTCGTPSNQLSLYDNSIIVKELFSSEEEAKQILKEYLDSTTFKEVKS